MDAAGVSAIIAAVSAIIAVITALRANTRANEANTLAREALDTTQTQFRDAGPKIDVLLEPILGDLHVTVRSVSRMSAAVESIRLRCTSTSSPNDGYFMSQPFPKPLEPTQSDEVTVGGNELAAAAHVYGGSHPWSACVTLGNGSEAWSEVVQVPHPDAPPERDLGDELDNLAQAYLDRLRTIRSNPSMAAETLDLIEEGHTTLQERLRRVQFRYDERFPHRGHVGFSGQLTTIKQSDRELVELIAERRRAPTDRP